MDAMGRVPALQQTRVAAFLMSCHGALARQLGISLTWEMKPTWHMELITQFYKESETVSLLLRATSWVPDAELLFLLPKWELAWLAKPPAEIADRTQGLAIDIAALGHAVHSMIRPAGLLPEQVHPQDPFALALRKIELESGRVMQAQILFLKSTGLLPLREQVTSVVESRHRLVRKLWRGGLAWFGGGTLKGT